MFAIWDGLDCSQECVFYPEMMRIFLTLQNIPQNLSESIKIIISQQSGLQVEDICILDIPSQEKRQEEVVIIVHYNEVI